MENLNKIIHISATPEFLNDPEKMALIDKMIGVASEKIRHEDIVRNIYLQLDKFENGRERFKKSAMFKQCIEVIARGQDPVIVLGQVIDALEKQAKEFEDYLMNGPGRSIIVPEQM
jgi:hypothetical protein